MREINMNVLDLEVLKELIKLNPLMEMAGMKPNTYVLRQHRGKSFLTADESESIEKVLSDFGLSYDRSKNIHINKQIKEQL